MSEIDSRRRGAKSCLVAAALLLASCSRVDPCRSTLACPEGTVCGLAGTCVPRPTSDAIRFVEVREVAASIRADEPEDRLVFGSDRDVELVFGPLPEGRLVSALLRLSPYPSASGQADALAEVHRGRRRAAVRYAIGSDAPLVIDVSELIADADPGETVAFSLSVRAGDAAAFEAASPRFAEPARRPTLTLVVR